jgi:hypothetical protein
MTTFACPICRHIKTDGHRCQSPALTTSVYCYHHRKLHRTRPSTVNAGPGHSRSVLYPLRSARSVQQALALVFTGVATKRISTAEAGKMLSALRIASENIRRSHE